VCQKLRHGCDLRACLGRYSLADGTVLIAWNVVVAALVDLAKLGSAAVRGVTQQA
jgi:hypothetical protein